MTDEGLFIKALQAGDNDAYRRLVEDYSHRIYRLCYSFLKDQALAEDQTQEVFVSIFNSIQQFKQNSKLSTWIYRITVSSCLDQLRASQRLKRRSNGIVSLFDAQDMIPLPSGSDPYHHLENKEYGLIIARTLDVMPDKYKSVFILKYMDALSQKEIAEIMEITEKAVEGILSRAKAILREEITRFFPEMRDKK